ncbi:nucleotidyltransferase domain-containing protein [Candidatus Woesearchaeota archaeon]|nr:nucleotidyltransferase domain-containing protein [Candidatus Woesearchaeota archaeon]
MNLITFLQNNENSRKVFGKRELKIIEKQLLGISLTQSEANRLSRDIRRKFLFIKECSHFERDFPLKKGAEIKKQISEIKETILKDVSSPRITKIVLFGSTVENKLTSRSDIDVAVIFEQINLQEATLFRKRILGKSPSRADIQVYNILPTKIKKEINLKGKTLYERAKN